MAIKAAQEKAKLLAGEIGQSIGPAYSITEASENRYDNVSQNVALIGGYRDLNVNYNKDGFLFDMSLHGPVLGLGFKF